jgi:hypothetical protein
MAGRLLLTRHDCLLTDDDDDDHGQCMDSAVIDSVLQLHCLVW